MGKNSRKVSEPVPTLLAWRKVSGLSRQAVVNIMGTLRPDAEPIDQATLGKWESGETAVRLPDLRLLAEVYGTTADRLLFDPTDNVTPALMKQAHDILASKDQEAIKAWLASGEFLPPVKAKSGE